MLKDTWKESPGSSKNTLLTSAHFQGLPPVHLFVHKLSTWN